MKIEVKLTLKIGLGIDLCRYKSDPKVYSHAWSVLPSYTPLLNQLFCLRADVSYFLCCTRKRDVVPFSCATKEIGDVCTQAINYLNLNPFLFAATSIK